jgi:protein required for attachment to host cells
MRGTLLLVANASRARLYHVAFDRLALLDESEHPASRLQDRELGAERAGRFHTSGGHRTAVEPDETLQEREHDAFAQELVGLLREHGRDQPVDIVIAAPTRFLARIAARLDDDVEARVTARLPRDYTGIGAPALIEILRTLGVRGLRAAAPV